jgi:hypothetical protein
MPLIPKFAFKVSKDGKSLRVKDVTGPFSVSSPGGYGTPNEAISAIASSSVTIKDPEGNAYTITGIASDVYAETTIPQTSIGVPPGESIPDGVYDATFSIVGALATYTYTTKFFVTWNVECCFEKAQAAESAIPAEGCGCSCKGGSNVADYFYMIWSANKAFYCGKIESAKAILEYLKQACKTLSCSNC